MTAARFTKPQDAPAYISSPSDLLQHYLTVENAKEYKELKEYSLLTAEISTKAKDLIRSRIGKGTAGHTLMHRQKGAALGKEAQLTREEEEKFKNQKEELEKEKFNAYWVAAENAYEKSKNKIFKDFLCNKLGKIVDCFISNPEQFKLWFQERVNLLSERIPKTSAYENMQKEMVELKKLFSEENGIVKIILKLKKIWHKAQVGTEKALVDELNKDKNYNFIRDVGFFLQDLGKIIPFKTENLLVKQYHKGLGVDFDIFERQRKISQHVNSNLMLFSQQIAAKKVLSPENVKLVPLVATLNGWIKNLPIAVKGAGTIKKLEKTTLEEGLIVSQLQEEKRFDMQVASIESHVVNFLITKLNINVDVLAAPDKKPLIDVIKKEMPTLSPVMWNLFGMLNAIYQSNLASEFTLHRYLLADVMAGVIISDMQFKEKKPAFTPPVATPSYWLFYRINNEYHSAADIKELNSILEKMQLQMLAIDAASIDKNDHKLINQSDERVREGKVDLSQKESEAAMYDRLETQKFLSYVKILEMEVERKKVSPNLQVFLERTLAEAYIKYGAMLPEAHKRIKLAEYTGILPGVAGPLPELPASFKKEAQISQSASPRKS